MRKVKRTPAGEALTDLMLDLFRATSLILTAGDRLVAPLGLTSARSWLARDLGANRQNVQRIVNDLNKDGLVALEANPHHRRAQLVVLTDKGKRAFEAAMDLQAPWVNDLADGFLVRDIGTVRRVVMALRKKLED
jgi:DNA-binding MarR family transcriptional regulator